MIEKSKLPDENTPQKRGGNLSRREFLKRTSWTIASAALPFEGILFRETSHAWSQEIKEGDSWNRGIAEFKKMVFNSPFERAAWFTKTKEVVSWSSFVRGERTEVDRDDDALFQFLKQNPAELQFAHNHPLSGLEIYNVPLDQVEDMREGKKSPCSIPPSVGDIDLTIVYQAMVHEAKPETIFYHSVIEPSGVWTITVDTRHPYVQAILKYDRVFQELKKELSEKQYEMILEKGQKIIFDPRPDPHQEPLMAEWYDINNELFDRESALSNERVNQKIAIAHFIKTAIQGETDYERLIKRYARLGARVVFRSYESLGL